MVVKNGGKGWGEEIVVELEGSEKGGEERVSSYFFSWKKFV